MSADTEDLTGADAPARVTDQDAIRALARVINVGGDATARQTLDDYLAQEDVTPDQGDDGDQGDGDGSVPQTRAERRAAQAGK